MRKLYLSTVISISFLALPLSFLSAQPVPVLTYDDTITGLSQPIDIVNAGDNTGRLFVVEQGGIIRVYGGPNLANLGIFMTVTGINIGGEEGLLSLAFPPNYENPDPAIGGFFYVWYTNSLGDLELARYHVSGNPNVGDPLTKQILLTINHPTNANHNGAKLNFGPDGYLYIGTGDGGGGGDVPNNAQNGLSLLGKMLRINPDPSAPAPYYTIPPDNPFIADPNIPDEIWALGLRNPWRWSFDRTTGDMWLADVGQGAREEVNFVSSPLTAGLNFGWRCYEGTQPYNTSGCSMLPIYHTPIFDYPHNGTTGGFSITGGFVYRGADPLLQGWYICADYVSGHQWKIRQTGPSTFIVNRQQLATGLPPNISTFGEAEDGSLFAASRATGRVYLAKVAGLLPAKLIEFAARLENGTTLVRWKTVSEDNLRYFVVEFSRDGMNFQELGNIIPRNTQGENNYTFQHHPPVTGRERLFYRLKMLDRDGNREYSSIASVEHDGKITSFVYPSLISDGQLNIFSDGSYRSFRLINHAGSVVVKKQLGGQGGRITIPVAMLPAGLYVAQLSNERETINQKIIINR